MTENSALNLGNWLHIDGSAGGSPLLLPARHLVTHGVVVGMTGSGKTGLVTVLAEEALRAQIPTIIIDVKGDLPNLLLTFPSCAPSLVGPWLGEEKGAASDSLVLERCAARERALAEWSIGEPELSALVSGSTVRVLTPGSTAGEPLHVLSALERRSARWDTDPEGARAALATAISLVLKLLGRDSDPAKSREHVLLSVLAERRLKAGENADIARLVHDVLEPPVTDIGVLPLHSFMKPAERRTLSAALNTLLASPSFASWRQGVSLSVDDWVKPQRGRTPAVVVSVAHLDDEERALVLGVVLEEILSWVRGLPGSSQLRALLIFDEIYGYLPPHPSNPPTKRALVSLMKQARAFGVGVVLATQNPMDLDYRALSNAGLWCLGRLQTDADRDRVVDGLNGGSKQQAAQLHATLKRLAPRWFMVQNAHARDVGPILMQPRHTMSVLRGPLTRAELIRAQALRNHLNGLGSSPTPPPPSSPPKLQLVAPYPAKARAM